MFTVRTDQLTLLGDRLGKKPVVQPLPPVPAERPIGRGLTVRVDQMAHLDDQAARKFAEKLRLALAKKYPHCLPSFPEPVQERIVMNMLGRAGRWGITWQSALSVFAELMLAIAPNFDEYKEVRSLLSIKGMEPNRVVLTLARRVSKRGWRQARAAAQDLPLFIAPEWIGVAALDATAAAIQVALGDKLGREDPRVVAASALTVASSLGLEEMADAGLTVAAWRLFYGKEYRDAAVHSWVADVFQGGRSPSEKVAMLKLRFSLDHQRFI